MKLTQLMKENEERPLSNEVKRHFLEIVSTYNKYQESMDRKSDITQVAETLGGITEAARTLAIKEAGDWFDKHTVKRNMSELDKLGKQFDKVALEARALDQRMAGLYEDMGHILSRYYKFGEITEDEMKNRLGINETKEEDCGCNPINEAKLNVRDLPNYIFDDPDDFEDWYNGGMELDKKGHKLAPFSKSDERKLFGFVDDWIESRDDNRYGHGSSSDIDRDIKDIEKFLKQKGKVIKESVNEQQVTIHNRTSNGNIVTTLKESDLNEEEIKLYEFGKKVTRLMEKNCPTNPSKWSSYKSQAKQKFDVYPSAYANGWAAKKYKAAGGGWKKC